MEKKRAVELEDYDLAMEKKVRVLLHKLYNRRLRILSETVQKYTDIVMWTTNKLNQIA